MECNKSEAIRAKEIAEKRMQNKDFAGAQKLALKAQKLYPGLENISQLLTVCEVHISAEQKVVGTEADWYGILQIPHTVDELSIKKQYRKLALILHPDKNKFPGAEAAFKLIGEANRVLSDQAKRSVYDIKRRTIQSGTTKQQNSFADNMRQPHQQQSEMPLTFWTSCPFCSTRYQQYRNLLNRVIRCQKCLNPFVAYDLNVQGVNSGYAWNQSAASQHNDIPNQGAHRTGQESTAGNSYSGFRCQENASNTEVGGRSQRKASEEGDVASRRAMFGEAQSRKSPRNVGRKRGRNAAAESGESFSSERADVRDSEQLEKKEMESSPIKKKNKQSFKDADNVEVNSNVASNPDTQDPISYPEPEFHDFDKDRVQENFQVAQIWAVYDDTDGMPRWYALIRKIYSNGSKLRILWLEADPKDRDGQNWLEEKLPVACGNFRTGKTQDTEDLLMFSHLASWEKGNSRNTYKIYPRKGEVWALFKDWSIQWSTSPDAHKKYEFEFVEILCDYADGTGVEVACLVMLEGFTSLFQQMENMEKNPCQVPPSELLRFSHRVPCYRMTGEERQGIPAGSFELDPASVFTEALSPAKGVDKVFDKSVDVESSTECCKPGTENKTPAVGTEILNTAKESPSQNEKITQNRENLEKGSCLSEAKEASTTVWPEKPNGIKKPSRNGKDIQSKENVTSTKFRAEKETPVTGPDVLNAPKKSTSSNEDKMHNKESLVNRRCSPRKIVRAHQKKPCQADASQRPVEEGTCFNGGACSLDGMPDNKPDATMSTKSQIDGRAKESVAGKVPQNGATEENCPPDPVFCGSVFEKLEGQFQRGQIWALYSSVDGGLPKYYARITKVESPKFRVHATWLEACPESEKEIWWSKKVLPVTCGKFKLQIGEPVTYEEASIFSHRMRHNSLKGKKYSIFPRKGEVWAIYKNWSSEWTHKDLEHCEYELVEVLNESRLATEVMVLEVVDGYRTVYRGSTKMDIPCDELLRFSHLVPSFRLTKEGGGKLKGCLELDSLALPDSFFSKTSK